MQKFKLGRVTITPGALLLAKRRYGAACMERIGNFLARHESGDWGDLNPSGMALQDAMLAAGRTVFSAYDLGGDSELWITTDAARSRTTVSVPADLF